MASGSASSNDVTVTFGADLSALNAGIKNAKDAVAAGVKEIEAKSTVTLKQPATVGGRTIGSAKFVADVAAYEEQIARRMRNTEYRTAVQAAARTNLRAGGLNVPLTRGEQAAAAASDTASGGFDIPFSGAIGRRVGAYLGAGFVAQQMAKTGAESMRYGLRADQARAGYDLPYELAASNPILNNFAQRQTELKFRQEHGLYGAARALGAGDFVDTFSNYGPSIDRRLFDIGRKADAVRAIEPQIEALKIRKFEVEGDPTKALEARQSLERFEAMANVAKFRSGMTGGGTASEQAQLDIMKNFVAKDLPAIQRAESDRQKQGFQASIYAGLTVGADRSRVLANTAKIRGDAITAFQETILADAKEFENQWRVRLAPLRGAEREQAIKKQAGERRLFASNTEFQAFQFAAAAPLAAGFSPRRAFETGIINQDRERIRVDFLGGMKAALGGFGDDIARFLTLQ